MGCRIKTDCQDGLKLEQSVKKIFKQGYGYHAGIFKHDYV